MKREKKYFPFLPLVALSREKKYFPFLPVVALLALLLCRSTAPTPVLDFYHGWTGGAVRPASKYDGLLFAVLRSNESVIAITFQ